MSQELHWQAKLGMTFIALGSIGLFLSSQNHIANDGIMFILMIGIIYFNVISWCKKQFFSPIFNTSTCP